MSSIDGTGLSVAQRPQRCPPLRDRPDSSNVAASMIGSMARDSTRAKRPANSACNETQTGAGSSSTKSGVIPSVSTSARISATVGADESPLAASTIIGRSRASLVVFRNI